MTSVSMTRLGDLTELISSGSTPTGGGQNYLASGEIMFIRSQNVRMNQLDLSDVVYITEEIHRSMRRTHLKEGDVLLNITGASIGRVAPFTLHGVEANVNQHVCIIRPKSALLSTKYLASFISTPRFQADIMRIQRGGTRQALTFSQIANFMIPLPSLKEQNRIAQLLENTKSIYDKRKQALAELDGLSASLFLEMFGDPSTNPKAWTNCLLGDVIHSAKDGPHVSPKYSESGVPFLSTRNVRAGKIVWEDLKYVSNEEARIHWKKCKPDKGDLLYTKGGTTGIAAVVDFDTAIAVWVHLAVLKLKLDCVDPCWLESMLNSQFCYEQSQILTHGIANRDLGLTRMIKISMYLPPLKLQKEFALRIMRLKNLHSLYLTSLEITDELFQAVQNDVFAQTQVNDKILAQSGR